jgi:hypothetical protein
VLARVADRVARKVEGAHPRKRAGSMALARDGSRRVLVHRRKLEGLDRLSRLRPDKRRTLATRKARRTPRFTRMAQRHSREGRGIGSEVRAFVVLLRSYLTCRLEALFVPSSHSLVRFVFDIIRFPFFFFFFFYLSLLSISHTSLSLTSCTFIVNYSVQNRVIVRLAAVQSGCVFQTTITCVGGGKHPIRFT